MFIIMRVADNDAAVIHIIQIIRLVDEHVKRRLIRCAGFLFSYRKNIFN